MADCGIGMRGALAPDVFRLAVEACPSGLVVTDGEGSIRLVNGEVERLFRYSREELLGRPADLLLPEALYGKYAQQGPAPPHAESEPGGFRGEFKGRRKDGGEFPIELSLQLFRVGDEQMVVGVIVDISERKRLERLQDEFVSTVSHELRTPITSIFASLGLLLAHSGQGMPKPAVHLLEIAQGNCQRLVRMVNDVLDFKKLDAGQMSFYFERRDARALLKAAVEANHSLAESNGVRIKLTAPARPIAVYVDPDRFAQVVTNLLSNAIKYAPPGTAVEVDLMQHGSDVRITVRDYGPGIPAHFKPRVFESFAQADGRGRGKGGSGLGLSIARKIVARMNGEIGFRDASGGGTVFQVDLPGADHVAPREDAEAAAQAGLRG